MIEPTAWYASVGGGRGNTIQTGANWAMIGGGDGNIIQDAEFGAIVGGLSNIVRAARSTIGGGFRNTIQTNASSSTIGGGYNNTIFTNAYYSTIGGGFWNRIQTDAYYATIPGGMENSCAGNYSFAAGRRAKANHHGSFVWADSRGFDFSSTVPNGFFVRGTGGVKFVTGIDGSGGETAGVRVVNGSSAWTTLSDRNSKENFGPVNPQAVLERLVAIPIQTWNWKAQTDGTRHIGPMAQDFHAAFNVGENERHISTVDADGVALAAIQGVNQKLEAENAKLKQRLERLERLVHSLTRQPTNCNAMSGVRPEWPLDKPKTFLPSFLR